MRKRKCFVFWKNQLLEMIVLISIYLCTSSNYILSNIEQSYDNIIQHRVNYNCNDEFCLMRIYQDVF